MSGAEKASLTNWCLEKAMRHLRLLTHVVEVARTGSIRRAAERLNLTPSAMNRRIQDLEREVGTPLF
jgi:DNA-binding transcriptional LysR family regulator